jgi:hypothetical protein
VKGGGAPRPSPPCGPRGPRTTEDGGHTLCTARHSIIRSGAGEDPRLVTWYSAPAARHFRLRPPLDPDKRYVRSRRLVTLRTYSMYHGLRRRFVSPGECRSAPWCDQRLEISFVPRFLSFSLPRSLLHSSSTTSCPSLARSLATETATSLSIFMSGIRRAAKGRTKGRTKGRPRCSADSPWNYFM